jgi:hypothetical protein
VAASGVLAARLCSHSRLTISRKLLKSRCSNSCAIISCRRNKSLFSHSNASSRARALFNCAAVVACCCRTCFSRTSARRAELCELASTAGLEMHINPPPRPTCGPRIVGGRKDPAILLLGPNALSASADSSLRSFPSEVEDNVEECDMRAYAFGLASGPCGPNSSIQTRINEQNQLQSQQVSNKGDPFAI